MEKIDHYEITFIVQGDIADNEQSQITEEVSNYISKNKGNIETIQELGRKKLQYPIKKSWRGCFYSLECDVDPSAIKEIEKELKLKSEIIRYLIIKKPANLTPLDINTVKTEHDFDQKKSKKRKTKASTPKSSPEPKASELKESPKKQEKTSPKKEENVDLDKKLDEILNSDLMD